MDRECIVAPKNKRAAALAVDGIFVFLVWIFITSGDLNKVNQLMEHLDPKNTGSLDLFVRAVFEMLTAFALKWLFCQTLYFCLLPALLGRGKTIGKCLLRISLLSRTTLEEMSPGRLVLREFIGRSCIETLLILPMIASVMAAVLTREGISLHDRIAGTIVVQDTSFII